MAMAGKTRILIMGAAGRDFHNFNLVYRGNPACEVVAFTAAQIPGIAHRRYPAELAGAGYPDGIAIHDEAELPRLVRELGVDQVVFAYSDLSHEQVMHRGSQALAAGADFVLLGPRRTMLAAPVPVVAVCAARTGCGKSQVARWLSLRLRASGLRVGIIRHPMPYGDLLRQRAQRFATLADLDRAACTVEEREEYEPHLAVGNVVHAGVDYAEVMRAAAAESDVLVWDGGNNDFPFLRPDLMLALTDALRPGQAAGWHPGETVVRMAEVVLVAKANAAPAAVVAEEQARIRALNPAALVLRGGSVVTLEHPGQVRGRRVLVVEDGPTLTHGGMATGAGHAAALAAGAGAIIDPRLSAAPAIAAVYAAFPHLGPVLPAMGYDAAQVAGLAATIAASGAEVVVSATPADLSRLMRVPQPVLRAGYEYEDLDTPGLGAVVDGFLARIRAAPPSGTA